MSFLNSISHFVSGASASARKLVSSISQDSNASGGAEVITPNIEVSEDSENTMPQELPSDPKGINIYLEANHS